MKKRITDRKFFEHKAEEVAQNLVGKFICYNNEAYLITKTEAYYHDEQDYNGKYFCYGVKDDTGENSKTCATIPLFRAPGTWCIYGGQLLLSVTSSDVSDNVLIKEIESPDGRICGPDCIANTFLLYQKSSNSNYWDIHGMDSLSGKSILYLAEDTDKPIPTKEPYQYERIRVNSDKKYLFSMYEDKKL